MAGNEKRSEFRASFPGNHIFGAALGAAMCMHGTAIPGLDMGGASIKINDDGSFNVLVGATDLGTGSDTVLAQIAAEVLGCRWKISSFIPAIPT